MKKTLKKKFLKEFYDCIYTVLIEIGGATENMREPFIDYNMDEGCIVYEWRFGHKLGFGGKYRKVKNEVDCYKEDETPERLELIEKINRQLKNIKLVYKEAFK